MLSFIRDLKDGCSRVNNPSTWTFWLMCAAVLILTLIGVISGVIAEIVYIAASNFQMMPCIIAVLCLVVFIGMCIFINKMR